MSFCSRASTASHETLAGTGVLGEAYVFLPVAKQLWRSSELNTNWASVDELAAVRAARAAGIVTRLYDPPAQDAAILVYAPEGARPGGLDPLLSAFAGRWGVDERVQPRIAICTHGTRDRCCAKFGFAVYRRARALFEAGASPFAPLECSHLGGDRFAATAVVFPSGSMYGHLDEADLAALLAGEAEGRITPAYYRGRVFEPPLTQIIRAGLAKDGFASAAAAPIAIEREPDGRLAVDCAEGRFLASVTTAEVAFYPSCHRMAEGRLTRGRRTVYAGAEPRD